MKSRYIVYIVVILCASVAQAGTKERKRLNSFLSLNGTQGATLKTNDFINQAPRAPGYSSGAIKFGIQSDPNSWIDEAYGHSYFGVGVYSAKFWRSENIGSPISIFLFQGASIWDINSQFALNYEWNLGISTNWKPYDPIDNPDNVALGSTVNAHVAGSLYLKWMASPRLDLHFGGVFTHFSNGSMQQPNYGLNNIGGFFELLYKFNVKDRSRSSFTEEHAPAYQSHFDHDISFTLSSRQTTLDTVGTLRPTRYVNYKFKIYGLSYGFVRAPNYKYKYGAGIDLLYDESSNAKAWRELNPADGKYYDRIRFGSFADKISMGIAARGEIVLPGYSMFAHFGWNFINGNHRESRLYQVLGVKVYLKENFFGTFGIRATHFSSAQFLYWSLGYTIRSQKKR